MKIFDYVDWDNWTNQNGIDHWKSLVKMFDESFETLEDCSNYKINFSSNMWLELEKSELLYNNHKINESRNNKLNNILNEKN